MECHPFFMCCRVVFWVGFLSMFLPYSAGAYSVEDIVTPKGDAYVRLHVYAPGESSTTFGATADAVLPLEEMDALKMGTLYWHSIIGDRASGPVPVIDLVPYSAMDDNASANSPTLNTGDTWLGYALLNGLSPEDASTPTALITIDRTSVVSEGWYTENLPVLPHNAMKSDLPGTMLHEMFHALGLFSSNGFENVFSQQGLSAWTLGLRDLYGTAARPGMTIAGLDFKTSSISPDENTFYMLNERFGGAYFTGDHVAEVLNGALLSWPDDSTTEAVPGLPVNGFEINEDGTLAPELSHIELQNSLMSHQPYRNWCTLMEAELAVVQDIGYSLDRRRFFGYSVYNSGTEGNLRDFVNEHPFYERNSTGDGWLWGVPSTQSWGIGLHIYGNWNRIVQQADLLTEGDWGMGIRMDGVGNQLTIAPGVRVHADGTGGNALLVAYGRDHEITSRGDLQALGEDGVAARFDFGSNEMGDYLEYRGSYIRTFLYSNDALWHNVQMLTALEGPLVSQFDVTGRLAGSAAAIYISPNALVRQINIMDGASILGDIVSEWNPAQPLYNGTIVQAPKGTDLTTDLAFGRLPDADGKATAEADSTFALRYDGNIRGAASLRMNLIGGLLSFNGTADVLDATVAEGSVLAGNGVYMIDAGGGTLTNAGTLSPGNSIGTMTISGNYLQTATGRLLAEADVSGAFDQLAVSGTARLAGRLAVDLAPGYYATSTSFSPITAGAFEGSFAAENIVTPTPTLSLASTRSNTRYAVSIARSTNAYSRYAESGNAASAGRALSSAVDVRNDMQTLYTALDFSNPDGGTVRTALSQLSPDAYGNAALVSLDMHRMLSDLILPGTFSRAPHKDGEWHVFVQPYAGTSDQPRGSVGGYDATNVGLISGAERSTLAGLTLGGHVVFNHQSMSGDTNGKLHGEGLYLGAQGRYAPADWNGWNVFGIGRVGAENWRMKRSVAFEGYNRENSKDWTGFSGTLRAGGGYEIEYETFAIEPFAALDYAFSSRPSLTENDGMGSRLHLGSKTYHSLRSSLGLRMNTDEKPLGEHATWQSHLSAAWNHELLDKAGTTRASFAEAANAGFSNTLKMPGRDSLGLGAGISLNTDKNVSFSLNAGSELFRHEGTSVYGNLAVEWKF